MIYGLIGFAGLVALYFIVIMPKCFPAERRSVDEMDIETLTEIMYEVEVESQRKWKGYRSIMRRVPFLKNIVVKRLKMCNIIKNYSDKTIKKVLESDLVWNYFVNVICNPEPEEDETVLEHRAELKNMIDRL